MMLPLNPVIWRGSLEFQKRKVPIHLHLINGNSFILPACVDFDGDPNVLNLQKTAKLRRTEMAEIKQQAEIYVEHTILIGLPQVDESKGFESMHRAHILKSTFVDYLMTRGCVGLAQLPHSCIKGESFTLRVLPHCELATYFVKRHARKELKNLADIPYLLFILTKNPTEGGHHRSCSIC